MSEEAKKIIQSSAWKLFPAQELWINKENNFWAFEKKENELLITHGTYKDNKIDYSISTQTTDDVDNLVDFLTTEKSQEGYECFAIEL